MRNYKIISELASKRKKVFRVESLGQIYILKEYASIEDAQKEVSIAKQMAMTGYAPKVIEHEGNLVLYEYVDGENFCDEFKRATMMDDCETMELLATRLSIFLQIVYSFTAKTMKVIDFTNYIVKDGRVIGVDLLNVDDGMPYEDVASAIAYSLTHCVGEYYECFPFVYKLLSCFRLEMVDVINEIKARLMNMAEWAARDNVDLDMLIDGLANFNKKGVDWRKLI